MEEFLTSDGENFITSDGKTLNVRFVDEVVFDTLQAPKGYTVAKYVDSEYMPTYDSNGEMLRVIDLDDVGNAFYREHSTPLYEDENKIVRITGATVISEDMTMYA